MVEALLPAKIRTPEQHELIRNLPSGFEAEQIIYREIFHDPTISGWRYKDIDEPTPCNPSFDIKSFASKVAVDGYVRNNADDEEEKLLDIPVSKPSYVLLEMNGDFERYFSKENSAVTLGKYLYNKHPKPWRLYGYLHHVDMGGNVSRKPRKRCRVAFFAALPLINGSNDDPFIQHLNYNVDDVGGTTIVIDPDIRYPGNGDG